MSARDSMVLWFKAARAPFLVVSFLPCLLAGALAWHDGSAIGAEFGVVVFILATLGIVMAHSAADFVDDYFDYKTGNLGNKDKQFHDSPLVDGKLQPGHVMGGAVVCSLIALACGIWLLIEVGLPVIYLTAAGAFIVLFYTAPPIRLNYRGLGETALFLAFGPMIVIGVYYLLTGTVTTAAVLLSIPAGIFTMNVGLVSNTFDHEDDVASGKATLAVRFGQRAAVRIVGITTLLAYLAVVAGIAWADLSPWTLLVFVTLPMAWSAVTRTLRYEDTANYTQAMQSAIALSSLACAILAGVYAGVTMFA